MNEEMIKKAKEAKSAEELLALAKENNIELTEEQAKDYFAQLHPATGELSDDELDNVAGGGCGKITCPKCGSTDYTAKYFDYGSTSTFKSTECSCNSCGYIWLI